MTKFVVVWKDQGTERLVVDVEDGFAVPSLIGSDLSFKDKGGAVYVLDRDSVLAMYAYVVPQSGQSKWRGLATA